MLARACPAKDFEPAPERVDLWLAPGPWPLYMPDWQGHLSEAQARALARQRDAHRARRYAWTQLWMMQILSRYVVASSGPLKLARTEQGKPYLDGPGPSFSLTHTQDVVALAVDPQTRPLGLDIEPVDPTRDLGAIACRFFAAGLASRLSSASPSMRSALFYTQWTRSEALAKATGQGLSTALLATQLDRQVRWQGQDYAFVDLQLVPRVEDEAYVDGVAVPRVEDEAYVDGMATPRVEDDAYVDGVAVPRALGALCVPLSDLVPRLRCFVGGHELAPRGRG